MPFRLGLKKLNQIATQYQMSVALPYGIGCGLANGDWEIIFRIIQEELKCEYCIYVLRPKIK